MFNPAPSIPFPLADARRAVPTSAPAACGKIAAVPGQIIIVTENLEHIAITPTLAAELLKELPWAIEVASGPLFTTQYQVAIATE